MQSHNTSRTSRNLLLEIDRLTTTSSSTIPLNDSSDFVPSSDFYNVPVPRRKVAPTKLPVPTTSDEQYSHSIALGRSLNLNTVPIGQVGIFIAESKDAAASRSECLSVLRLLRQEL